jgi:hypothetical protein
MRRVLTAKFAELFEFKLVGGLLLVFGGRVVLTLTLCTIQTDDDSHGNLFFSTFVSLCLGLELTTRLRGNFDLQPFYF